MKSIRPLPLVTAMTLAMALPVTGLADVQIEAEDRIRVTADPLGDRGPDDLVRPVDVISGDELQRRMDVTLGLVLDGLPGVSNSDFGPGVGRPVVRGLQGSRVQVLEDGMGVSDVSREGADHAISIDMSRATQIEVFRGPATLLYGSGAAGGVVNVVSGRFGPATVEAPQIEGRVSYGFNGNDRQGRVAVEAPVNTGFVLRADYGMRRTDNFDIKGFQESGSEAGTKGELLASAIEHDTASISGVFNGSWGYLGAGLTYLDSTYDIPKLFDPRPRELGGLSDHFDQINMESVRFDVRGEWNDPMPGFSTARLKMSYTDFEQEEAELFFTRAPEGGVFDFAEVEAEFSNTEWDTRFELIHQPLGNWRGVFGLHYTDRDFTAGDPDGDTSNFYVRPNDTSTLALFVVEELPTDFGRIEVGARVERVKSTPEDVFGYRVTDVTQADGSFLSFSEQLGSASFTPFSVSGGVKFNVGTDYHARASLSRSERAPSPEQLYAFGRHPSAGTFEVGNPDLDKEAYTNIELGFDRHAGPFRFEAAVFYNRVSDFIFLASEDDGSGGVVSVNDIGNRAGEGAAANCAPGAGGLCRLRNQLVFVEQANAEFYGAEFSSTSTLSEGPIATDLRFTGDYVRGKLRDGGNLPRITPMRLGIGLDARYTDWRFSVDYQRVFEQTNTAVAESETAGFDLLGFDVFWAPPQLGGAELFLRGRNLLNEDGRRHQSFFKDSAPMIGRAVTAGLRFEFGG
jgi:iron complex outermembrane receptor protein